MYEMSNPADTAAIMQTAARMDSEGHIPVAAPAKIIATTPATGTTPAAAVQPAATPPAVVAPAPGEPESLEALEARLMAAGAARRDAELAADAEAARQAQEAAGNETLLRDTLRRSGIDYNEARHDVDTWSPPVSTPRPGHNEPAAAPMNADTLYALRILEHNRPALDLWGTNIPGSRR